jgi:hypothetical protein
MQDKDGIAIGAFQGAEFPVDCVMSRVGLLGERSLLGKDEQGYHSQEEAGWV